MIKAVIFDLDDTLYLEADFVRSGFQSVGEWCRTAHDITGVDKVAWRLFCEGRRGNIFDLALVELRSPLGKDAVLDMVRVYRTHPPAISLPTDSAECIKQLRGKYKLGLISDGPSEMQWNKVRALHLDACLNQLIVTADLGRGFSKPHEKAFIQMEELFSVTGAALVYVADNPAKDFVAPSKRGWRTIRIIREGCLYKGETVAAGSEFCVEDLKAAAAVILSL
jgi:putative hydrolase of the HAD superfamily